MPFTIRWIKEDEEKLKPMSLTKQQRELRKYVARMRLKKAMYSVSFVPVPHNLLFRLDVPNWFLRM